MASSDPNQELNPYAPPSASLDEPLVDLTGDLSRAEAIRRMYLNHEASVKSVGALHIAAAVFFGIATIAGFARGLSSGPLGQPTPILLFGIIFVLYGGIAALNAAVGVGLRQLKTWARWVDVALLGLSLVTGLGLVVFALMAAGLVEVLVGLVIWVLIPGYVLYLLVSPKGTMVFSPEYRRVIEQTPHIKYKMSCLLRGLLFLLIGLFGLGIIGAIVTFFFRQAPTVRAVAPSLKSVSFEREGSATTRFFGIVENNRCGA